MENLNANEISIYLATMQWAGTALYFAICIAAVVLVGAILRRFEGIFNYVGWQLQKGAALFTGVALILFSAAINSTYALEIIKAYPEYKEHEGLAAVLLGCVNFAAIWAAFAVERAKVRKEGPLAVARIYAGWSVIVIFSLVTASTMLATGNDRIIKMNTIAADYKLLNDEKIQNNKESIKAPPIRSASVSATGNKMTTNSNGARVRVSSVCKSGNWYAKNREPCRNYLAALDASGTAARNANLRSQNTSLLEDSIQRKESAPVPLNSSFGPIQIPFSWMALVVALVIEIAAGLSLGQAMQMGAFRESIDGGVTLPPSRSQTGSNNGSQTKKKRSQKKTGGSQTAEKKGSGNKINDLSEVNEGLDKTSDHVSKTDYKGAKLALNNAIAGLKGSEIKDDHLKDLIAELCRENAGDRIVAKRISALIKSHTGVGVGNERLLFIFNDPEMSDYVLKKNVDGSKNYFFRETKYDEKPDIGTVQSGQDGAGEQGLPSSREVSN